MNLVYFLGSIGGIMCLIGYILKIVDEVISARKKYQRMKLFYEKNHKDNEKMPMGFMTETERKEIEDRFVAKTRS